MSMFLHITFLGLLNDHVVGLHPISPSPTNMVHPSSSSAGVDIVSALQKRGQKSSHRNEIINPTFLHSNAENSTMLEVEAKKKTQTKLLIEKTTRTGVHDKTQDTLQDTTTCFSSSCSSSHYSHHHHNHGSLVYFRDGKGIDLPHPLCDRVIGKMNTQSSESLLEVYTRDVLGRKFRSGGIFDMLRMKLGAGGFSSSSSSSSFLQRGGELDVEFLDANQAIEAGVLERLDLVGGEAVVGKAVQHGGDSDGRVERLVKVVGGDFLSNNSSSFISTQKNQHHQQQKQSHSAKKSFPSIVLFSHTAGKVSGPALDFLKIFEPCITPGLGDQQEFQRSLSWTIKTAVQRHSNTIDPFSDRMAIQKRRIAKRIGIVGKLLSGGGIGVSGIGVGGKGGKGKWVAGAFGDDFGDSDGNNNKVVKVIIPGEHKNNDDVGHANVNGDESKKFSATYALNSPEKMVFRRNKVEDGSVKSGAEEEDILINQLSFQITGHAKPQHHPSLLLPLMFGISPASLGHGEHSQKYNPEKVLIDGYSVKIRYHYSGGGVGTGGPAGGASSRAVATSGSVLTGERDESGEVTVQDVIRVGRQTDTNFRDGLSNIHFEVCEQGQGFFDSVCLGEEGGLWGL